MGPLTYLACPYSHNDPVVRRARFEVANFAAGQLMRKGHLIFSPISHTHPIAEVCGWDRSTGVTVEIKIAKEIGLKIEYLVLTGLQMLIN